MNKKHPGVYLRGKVYWIKYSRTAGHFGRAAIPRKNRTLSGC